jgi:hypoxanthine phosphoribosyltransferase
MHKEFIPYTIVRNNSIKLAHRIHETGFIPDVIYLSLRGGAYLGNIVSEYFKLVRKDTRPVFYAAVVARSYSDIKKQTQVMIDGWTYNPEFLRNGDKVLIVDDIFDSGNTINYLAEVIMRHGIPREDLKVAVHDYKNLSYLKEKPPIIPDFFCRKIDIPTPDDDVWIHYNSHELVGLTPEEVETYYSKDDPEVGSILRTILGME